MLKHIKNYRNRNPGRSRFIIAVLILMTLLLVLRLALSPGIIYGATSWLKDQGIDANIESIEINIIKGSVQLINATGNKDGKQLFNVGLIEIHWQWQPLSKQTIEISKIALDALSINIKQYQDAIIIGGVQLSLAQTETQPEMQAATQAATQAETPTKTQQRNKANTWAAALGEINFSNLKVCYLQHTTTLAKASEQSKFIDYCLDLEKMLWAGKILYASDTSAQHTSDIPLTLTGEFTLNGLSITDNKLNRKLLTSKSNTLDKVVISGLNKLHINRLQMNQLSLLQRNDKQHIDAVRFSHLIIDDIKLSNLNSLAIDSIEVSKPGLYLVKETASKWELEQWLPASKVESQTPNKKTKETKPENDVSSFQFTLNKIIIDDSDFCYLDKQSSLYYCLLLKQLNFKGDLHFDSHAAQITANEKILQGNITLLGANIHNHNISRNLLDFKSLSLSNIGIDYANNITISDFELASLTALQRSDKADDNSLAFDMLAFDTLAFDTLAINNTKLNTQEVSVNAITLDGLSGNFSKNKKGNWEHDKWLNHTEKTNDDSSVSAESHIKAAEENTNNPLIIALSKLSVDTEKEILFTDNSTTPVTKAGLKKLKLELSDLYTNKPNSNTNFKLFAKTTRHSTIDIAGTAKPFAEKISIDANGKLKGFDLRAVSATSKKAIGHTIKSGQLDADLTLLAVDGELDSNIALSLYHFNIKASSKQDAEKLDEKFGMPLNQTLLLLRDKDDSIHLDIPITGNVNNPNFNPMDAIIKATSKAATVTLITFYTPYGLIYAGGNLAFNLATALNFDPIDFSPGESQLSDSSKQQLDSLSKLLTEKPHVHLTLCGVTNQQDIIKLYPDLKARQDNKNTTTEKTLTSEQIQQLQQLAQRRQVNSKTYLVENSGIEHNRLILCQPEHNTEEDAVAGVEINI